MGLVRLAFRNQDPINHIEFKVWLKALVNIARQIDGLSRELKVTGSSLATGSLLTSASKGRKMGQKVKIKLDIFCFFGLHHSGKDLFHV